MNVSSQRARELFDRYRASQRAWRLTLAAVFALEAIMLLRVGRHQWYFFDEWRLVVERVIPRAHGVSESFKQLFKPDGEHVIAIPLALFIALTRLAGIDNYWPFVFANIVVRLVTMWLADDIIRRLGARRAARLLALVSIAFFGAGFESLFGQSVIFAAFTLVFCLMAIRQALLPSTSQWRTGVLAALYLVGAIFSSSYGFPVVVGVTIYFILSSRRIAAALSLTVPPIAFLVVRALAGGSYAQQQPVAFSRLNLYVDYVQYGLARLGEGMTGIDGLGLVSYLALVALCIWFGRGRQQAWFAISMVCTVVAFYGQASLSRSVFGAEQAGASRYVFFCGVLSFVMLAGSWGQRRLELRAATIVALLIVVSFANSAGRLVEGSAQFTNFMQVSKGRLSLGFVAVERGVDPLVPDPENAPDLYLSRLQDTVHWSGSDRLIATGESCYEDRLDELTAAGIEVRSLTVRDQAALVLLLNEHSLGYLADSLSIGDLITRAAEGDTGSLVLDQFADDYTVFLTELALPAAVPSIARCR